LTNITLLSLNTPDGAITPRMNDAEFNTVSDAEDMLPDEDSLMKTLATERITASLMVAMFLRTLTPNVNTQ
jgi:hypothetical protein